MPNGVKRATSSYMVLADKSPLARVMPQSFMQLMLVHTSQVVEVARVVEFTEAARLMRLIVQSEVCSGAKRVTDGSE